MMTSFFYQTSREISRPSRVECSQWQILQHRTWETESPRKTNRQRHFLLCMNPVDCFFDSFHKLDETDCLHFYLKGTNYSIFFTELIYRRSRKDYGLIPTWLFLQIVQRNIFKGLFWHFYSWKQFFGTKTNGLETTVIEELILHFKTVKSKMKIPDSSWNEQLKNFRFYFLLFIIRITNLHN